jgi:hypothetical protein
MQIIKPAVEGTLIVMTCPLAISKQVRRIKRPTPQIYTLSLLNSFMHLMGKNLVQDWYCFPKPRQRKQHEILQRPKT